MLRQNLKVFDYKGGQECKQPWPYNRIGWVSCRKFYVVFNVLIGLPVNAAYASLSELSMVITRVQDVIVVQNFVQRSVARFGCCRWEGLLVSYFNWESPCLLDHLPRGGSRLPHRTMRVLSDRSAYRPCKARQFRGI